MIDEEQNAATRTAAVKEAFGMYDSFSDGSVFYGRTAVILVAVTVLAAVLHLI